eukprot:Lithocolla_globosa_v1_NODE_250_length_4845_cov_7.523591.p4 type:complete len:109 gc:universal NODE_250_length_4845_cov_7.523591:929-1255(+)
MFPKREHFLEQFLEGLEFVSELDSQISALEVIMENQSSIPDLDPGKIYQSLVRTKITLRDRISRSPIHTFFGENQSLPHISSASFLLQQENLLSRGYIGIFPQLSEFV